jgi:general secretion pathway protein J
MNPARPRHSAGFTLVELLIALLIFGLLSAAATALLSFGIDARGRTAERLETVSDIARLRALMTTDLAQAAPRAWRDESGTRRAAFVGRSDTGALIGFVRRGWRNEAGAPRASLQRVEYRVTDGRLERQSAPMLDGTRLLPPAVLLTGIRDIRVRFFNAGQWLDSWRPEAPDALPSAVELTVITAGQPQVRQVFLVGPGAVPPP